MGRYCCYLLPRQYGRSPEHPKSNSKGGFLPNRWVTLYPLSTPTPTRCSSILPPFLSPPLYAASINPSIFHPFIVTLGREGERECVLCLASSVFSRPEKMVYFWDICAEPPCHDCPHSSTRRQNELWSRFCRLHGRWQQGWYIIGTLR